MLLESSNLTQADSINTSRVQLQTQNHGQNLVQRIVFSLDAGTCSLCLEVHSFSQGLTSFASLGVFADQG